MDKNLIIDVGVHTGEDSEFYLKKGFRVIGIEANPDIYEDTKKKLGAYIETGQLILLNVAVSSQNQSVTFYVNLDKSFWSTTSLDFVRRNEFFGTSSTAITVEGRTFENILQEFGIPYYLKVDIEGADILCLQALHKFETKPQFLSIESAQTSWNDLLAELALLKELGYKKFKAINQKDVPKQVCPFPAKEGEYIKHQFEYGASGIFGEETPGNWLSETEVLKVYKYVFLQYRLFESNGFFNQFSLGKMLLDKLQLKLAWYDTHASL
ncbi:FkbM family methyltransferase [Nostoc sp. 'Peltigera membranacea cyanobiont' 213]|uniref:FkbM family methyltransferase n=2 Tax=Nostoc TaxID=1177 RepID=UPI000B954E59|nr:MULTISPECIES: FkbM family methyltransferase [unclassified Nostoc]AVH67818.1 FkbM family methyltransferase [Nostoc sp. 'Peltigera membranacea cyanobiont' N6]OYD98697.1 FkbM family methyltransferase [Nostoc sp. 'Peltigera membranacea cyanobiont' 213]